MHLFITDFSSVWLNRYKRGGWRRFKETLDIHHPSRRWILAKDVLLSKMTPLRDFSSLVFFTLQININQRPINWKLNDTQVREVYYFLPLLLITRWPRIPSGEECRELFINQSANVKKIFTLLICNCSSSSLPICSFPTATAWGVI